MKKKMPKKLMLTLFGTGLMLIILGGIIYAVDSSGYEAPDVYGVGC